LYVSLENQAKISLLKSDRWLFNLLKDENKQTEHKQFAIQCLRDQLNTLERRDSLDMVFTSIDCDLEQIYSLDFIEGWLQRLLFWQGDQYIVNKDYLDEWLSICSQIDPAIVLGWGYSSLISNNMLVPEQISKLPQCLQALQKDNLNNYADNHSHLGGNGSHRKAFVEFSCSPFNTDQKSFNWPTLYEFSFINSGLLNASDLPRLQHALFCYLVEALIASADGRLINIPNIDEPITLRHFNQSLKALVKEVHEVSVPLELLNLAFESDSDNAALLIWSALFSVERNVSTSDCWRKLFRAFIHTTQVLRAGMIHKGAGLSYFTEFFRFKERKGEKKSYGKYSQFSDLDTRTCREFKVSPGVARQGSLKKAFQQLESKGLNSNGHFCLHFTRSGHSADKLQRTKRHELRKEVNRLSRLLSSFDAQNVKLLDKDGEMEKAVNVLNLVRTLDVAGNENELKIEIFAPSIRYLRSCPWNNPYPYYKPQPRLGLSVHAGEDFNHIISGLRHIDETVEFCEFSYGDRLGHALALGINPTSWAISNPVTYVKVGEHLDNLIWLYHQAIELSMQLPALQAFASRLEIRALKWAENLLDSKYCVTSLYDAWKLRRNCPIAYHEAKSQSKALLKPYLPDFERNVDRDDEATQIWRSYFMADQLERKKPNPYERVITIRHVERNHPDAQTDLEEGKDYFTNDEIALIIAIQDALMHKYDCKGITLEVCPSSNIYIGHFKCYSQHPVFRWNPPKTSLLIDGEKFNRYGIRKGPVRVCVNTDDAGLFPTTIVNEHRVLKEAAIRHFNTCREEAETWIDRVRIIGLEEFNRNHIES